MDSFRLLTGAKQNKSLTLFYTNDESRVDYIAHKW